MCKMFFLSVYKNVFNVTSSFIGLYWQTLLIQRKVYDYNRKLLTTLVINYNIQRAYHPQPTTYKLILCKRKARKFL